MRVHLPPAAGLAVGVFAVSTAAVLIKACSVPSLGIAAWRMGFASLGFLAACAVRGHPLHRRLGPRNLALGALAGLFLGLHFAVWIASLSYTSVASSTVLVTTTPLWVGLGSWALLREPPGRAFWQGLAVAGLGALLVASADRVPATQAAAPLLGDLLALAGALAGSVYFLVGRRAQGATPGPPAVDTLSWVTWVYTVAAVVLMLGAGLAAVPLAGYTARDWTLLALLALVPQGLGHTLLNRSLRHFSAGVVALAILGEPVGAAALAWLLLDQVPTPLQVLGAGLILGGVARSQAPSP